MRFPFALTAALALAPAATAALPRATIDRPDDINGEQVHVVYAVPADGADRRLDEGAIAPSVGVWNEWLRSQTGGRGLKLDTAGGELDVTFLRLSGSDAEIAAKGAYVRDEIERQLGAVGLNARGKVYAVYYDGTSTWACGGGAWPPTLPGNTAAMYLNGLPLTSVPCRSNPLAGAGGAPGYMEFAMLHEILHTIGIVGTCAPHHTQAGHVSDSPADLMYAGDQPWRPSVLDVGRDDYFQSGISGCTDLSTSAYLEGNPGTFGEPTRTVQPKPKSKPKKRCKPVKRKRCR
jgi:hypothetical protein